MVKSLRVTVALAIVGVITLGVTASPAFAAGFGQIRNVVSGKCIDVWDKSTDVHAEIKQFSCTGNTNQAWHRIQVNGGFQLLGQQSGLCLDIRSDGPVPNGTTLQLYPCVDDNGIMATVWQVLGQFNNTAQIVSPPSGKCIDLDSGSTANGAKIQMWDCITNNTNQIWTIPS